MDKSFCHQLQIHSPEKQQLQTGKTIIAAAYSRVLDVHIFWFVEELLGYKEDILWESEHYNKNEGNESNQFEHWSWGIQ